MASTNKTAGPAESAILDGAGDIGETLLRNACTRFLNWHGQRPPAELLADIPADVTPDRYGEGGVVAELEHEVASLLGMAAAVFLPSGTMAQQAALRVHADRRGRRTVVFHPTCHLDHHEGRAYQRLHGLLGRPAGDAHQLLTLDDLQAVAEPPAALLVELPQREIGGRLPEWDDLVAQVEWARERGAAVHLDGARLWECTPFYRRTPAEIAALFDTVYVSFYKGLGGLGGCCLAGQKDIVAEVREWRKRHGGTLFLLWPYAASALTGLRRRLPRMPEYYAHAQAIAAAARTLPGVEVVPDPPQTTMMHLSLRAGAEQIRTAALQLAEQERIWT
ncbi:MAG: threonine aldolase family protein, partial [Dehalococcoidia bacterium]